MDNGRRCGEGCNAGSIRCGRHGGTPLVTDGRVARRLAADEYRVYLIPSWRYGGGSWMLTSRGSDGEFHFRGTAATEREARVWELEQVEGFRDRILSGEIDGLLVFGTPEDPVVG